MKITKRQLKRIIRESLEEFEPFGTGMRQAKETEDHPLIGHTWLTHGKIQDESLREALGITGNPIGKIVHHDLEKNGTINYYNIQFKCGTFNHIPARLIESIKEHQHEHDEKD